MFSSGVRARTDAAGLLYPMQSVYLNGTEIDSSHTVTTGDVDTKESGTATLQFSGSIVLIPPDSVVKLESGWLGLDTGTISMKTGKEGRPVLPDELKIAPSAGGGLSFLARDLRISPASADTTSLRSQGPTVG